jgi:hypothetical protein
MKKVYLCLVLLFTCLSLSIGQTYNFSGGLRLGTEIGFTLKYRIADKVTLEGIVQSPIKSQEAITTLLIEKHNSIMTKGLNIYYGGGVQKGWLLSEIKEYDDPFGVVGIIGAEFNIARINLSYDLKPAVNIIGGSSPVILQTGISIRYIFDKRNVLLPDPKLKSKKKKKRLKEKAKRKKFKQKMKDKYKNK